MNIIHKYKKSYSFISKIVWITILLVFYCQTQSPVNLASNGKLILAATVTQYPYCANGIYGWWADLDSTLQIYQGSSFNSGLGNQNVLVLDNNFHKAGITSFPANGNSFLLTFNCTLNGSSVVSTNGQSILKIYINQIFLTEIILINTSIKNVSINLTNISNGINQIKFLIDDSSLNSIGITGLGIYNANPISTNSSNSLITTTSTVTTPTILNKMIFMTSLVSLVERQITFDTIIINYQSYVPTNLSVQSIFVLFFFMTGRCGGNQREYTFTIKDAQSSFIKWLKGYCYWQDAWSYSNQQFQIPANDQRQFLLSLSTQLSVKSKLGVYLTGYKLT